MKMKDTMTRLRRFQFRFLIVLWFSWMVVAQETASMVIFDLISAAAINDSIPGVMAMSFGSPPQDVNVLVSFYGNSEAAVHVPTGVLCLTSDSTATDKTWNAIQEPWESDFVSTTAVSGMLVGIQTVQWRASTDTKKVNISLRKGRGGDAENITVIEEDIINSGEYLWDAKKTFSEEGLKAASDYSLMLWTESPVPHQSISGYFSFGPSESNITTSTRDSDDYVQSAECLDYLRSNGGYYNQTGDADFNVDILTKDGLSNPNTAFQIQNLAVGSTSLSWSTKSDISTSVFQLQYMPINLIWQSTLGMGVVGLSALQKARNSRVPEMDIISLNLGTGENTGSVVMGGYDDALIDHDQKTVFSRIDTNGTGTFEVVLSEITYIGSSNEKVQVSNTGTSSESNIALAYDSPNIQLSGKVLKLLLPLIGSPKFSQDLNGYVYSGTPRTDYSLKFTLGNGTSSTSIIVPASSLIVSDTSDNNPLTSRTESGQTYLRLSPSSDNHPAYLGRAFLQHAYVINGPPTIPKFLISAIPSPHPKSKSLVPASRASILMFNTSPVTRDKPAIGPMVGGILGGLLVMVGGIIAWIWFLRRRRNRSPQTGDKPTVRFADNQNPSSIPSYGYEKDLDFSKSSSRTGSKTATTSLSSFSRDIGSFSLPPGVTPEPPEKDPELMRRLSQQSNNRKRQSEGSTVARVFMGPYSPQIDDIEELHHEIQLQRTATVGRFISGANVAKVDGSPPLQKPERVKIKPLGRSHVRTASIGRICTPTSVEFPVSRRGSMRTVGSTDLLSRCSVDGSGSDEKINVIKEEEGSRGKKPRWSKSSQIDDGEDSDVSSVFGLDAVTKDGSEFLTSPPASEQHEANSENDSSRPTTTETTNDEQSILKASPQIIKK